HVQLFDSTTSGWITCREGRESPWWYAGLERDDFLRLKYRVGLRSVQEKDYSAGCWRITPMR
ncbi:MAG: hypothetical protein ACE5JA_07280, partial [bacterium]